jgi:citrate lyase beta subunit
MSDGRGPLVLYGVLWGVAERTGDAASSIDGIVFPKVEHPDEVDLLHLQLSEAEASIGIAAGSLRMALMVETAAAVGHVAEIAARAASRLSSLIFGIADYSADLGLATISNEQATVDWARAAIINAAASVGVPAIDGMTLAFPVSDPDLDGPANRARFLDRMALAYDDAVRARDMGMAGKWVGHPAQLFAAMLAFDDAFTDEHVEREARVLGHRVDGVGSSAGVGMFEGLMADRATDRRSHTFLRRATAMGRFDATRALALGIIDEAELAELSAATAQTEMTR